MRIGSIQEWAESQNPPISRVAAYKRIKTHSIPWISPGKIDMDEADRIWQASMNPAKQRGGEAGGDAARGARQEPLFADDAQIAPSMLGRVQLQHALLRVQKERLTIQQMEGKLVSLAAVREFEARVFALVRSSLLVIPAEIRDDLAACDDPVECQRIMDDRIAKALRQLANFRPEPEEKPVEDSLHKELKT